MGAFGTVAVASLMREALVRELGFSRRNEVGVMGQVITANRLRDGIVVFFGAGSTWVETIGAACVFDTAEAAEAGLAETRKSEADNLVLDVYAVEVAVRNGAVRPVRLREAIRASGPTIHPEHGKGPASAQHG